MAITTELSITEAAGADAVPPPSDYGEQRPVSVIEWGTDAIVIARETLTLAGQDIAARRGIANAVVPSLGYLKQAVATTKANEAARRRRFVPKPGSVLAVTLAEGDMLVTKDMHTDGSGRRTYGAVHRHAAAAAGTVVVGSSLTFLAHNGPHDQEPLIYLNTNESDIHGSSNLRIGLSGARLEAVTTIPQPMAVGGIALLPELITSGPGLYVIAEPFHIA